MKTTWRILFLAQYAKVMARPDLGQVKAADACGPVMNCRVRGQAAALSSHLNYVSGFVAYGLSEGHAACTFRIN